MTVWLVSYSARGSETAARLAAGLTGCDCRRFAPPDYCRDVGAELLTDSATAFAQAGFQQADALIFVCAAGIAVRAIAPWVKSKQRDPAVLVVDELGRFAIPILSGHLGGANRLALDAAAVLGATPVVTTATDLNGVFAVDVFAKENGLYIQSMPLAKEISAALLAGKSVGFRSDLPYSGTLPAGLTEGTAELGICISAQRLDAPFSRTLYLTPRRYAVGLGCKRGKPLAELEEFFLRNLAACGVTAHQIACIATIDVKKDEPGLQALAQTYALPLQTYSAEELSAVPGQFSGSGFVQRTVGVDCVCERAAVLAAGGTLIKEKTAAEGMTFALAKHEEGIRFE